MTVIRRVENYYPSPQARDCHSGTARPHGWATQRNLNDFVLRWPTPMASDGTKYRLRGDTQASKCLATVVRFPTPRMKDMCGGSGAKAKIDGNPNLSADEKRHMKGGAQLNPDWEEWLIFWPVGWTDLETPNHRLYWLDPSIDPADFTGAARIPRITNRRDNRPARVKEIGNGQFPLSAVAAFFWGLCVLEVVV